MPVYVYETVPQQEDETPERFEVYQSIKADPMQVHPENGKPVRRIVIGGLYIPKKSGIQHSSSSGDCCGDC